MLINPNLLQSVSVARAQMASDGNSGTAFRTEPGTSARAAAVSGLASGEPSSAARPKDPFQSDPQGAQPDAKELDQAVTRAKEYIQSVRRDLNLSYDEETGLLVIKVVDKDTEEVVRQIPPEEILAFIHNMLKLTGEREGVLLKEKA
ncbi:MAG: flagellar protein FlaG [Gammaproteobacteria bacterium]|nr:flagellar protein FlaG [Gammaproteobacteria bacterium]